MTIDEKTPPPTPSLKGRGKYKSLAFFLAIIAVSLDQISKWLILEKILSPERPFIETTSFFNIALVWNYGVSFGMFAGHRQPLLLTCLSILIVGILIVWLTRNTSKLVALALGCVIGGAIGNIIDRLRFGAVTDFLDFHLGNYHWPAFNIADSCIFIGVVLLCISSMLPPNTSHKGNIT